MRDNFCGWYFKCQSDTQTMAVIPAVHTSKSCRSCSLQLITDTGAWSIPLPYAQFHKQGRGLGVQLGENRFSESGFSLRLRAPGFTAKGSLRFGPLSPLRYDIMGPFRYMPFMECRHGIWSMDHTVNGEIQVNGEPYRFQAARGYIEGDRGYSFPRHYAWTHCFFEEGSVSLSAADIPLGPVRFTGVIGVVLWQGREYRLATYLGAKAVRIAEGELVIRQGDYILTARLLEKRPHPLLAPVSGDMRRTIGESAACRASYHFQKGGRTLFYFESPMASFEYEYPR